MAVTTSYSWTKNGTIDFPTGGGSPAATAISDGRFVALNDDGTDINGTIYDSDGEIITSWTGTVGTEGSIVELDNGNLLIVSQDTNSIVYEIRNGQTGAIEVASFDIGDIGGTNAVVTAVAGGFVIANADLVISDHDMDARFFSNDGVLQNSRTLDSNTGIEEENPSIATLNNGNVIIAWQEDETRIQFEVWSPDGATRISGNDVIADNIGSINRNVSVTALANGGFALVYEDNEFQPNGLSLATFDAAGVAMGKFNISGDGAAHSDPDVTVLANGFLAISVTETLVFGPGFTSTLATIRTVDPATGEILADDVNASGDFSSVTNTRINPEIITLENGSIVALHEIIGLGSATFGEQLELVRFTTGDATSNIVNGDELIDVMTGGAEADFFYGFGGSDRLFGEMGADWLYGGDGDDVLDGDAGADLLFGEGGDDEINGGDGDDFIYGGIGSDLLIGEDGVDWIYGEDGNDVILGQAGGDILFGGIGEDEIYGGLETDTIFGEAGDDTLYGQEGGDVISGQDGSDEIHGGAGGDFIFGGDNEDLIYGGDGNDQLFGQNSNDVIFGGNGDDYIDGGFANDALYGNAGTDSIFGGADSDALYGGEGGDVLNGGASFDKLFGGADGDFLFGDAGTDTINGGTGNDQLYGFSAGATEVGVEDRFLFDGPGWGVDTIHDYEDGVDRIQFMTTTGLDDFADLTVSTSGSDAVLSLGADSITILNAAGLITVADIDFLV